jgi:hypothetical protein
MLVTAELGRRFPLVGGPGDPASVFYGVGVGYWVTAAFNLVFQAFGEAGADHHLWLMPGFAWSLLGPDPYEKQRQALRLKAKQALASLEAELGVKIDTTPGSAAASAAQAAASGPAFGGRTPVLGSPGRITFFVTGGPSIGGGPGWQVLGGIQISSFDEFLQDSDGDGIPDRIDQCPFEPEDWDGYQDEDGCPDHGAEILRKRAEEQIKATEAKAAKLTTPVPRFRLRIPAGEVPGPGTPRREAAPMYQPGEPPPVPPAPPAPPAPPVRPEQKETPPSKPGTKASSRPAKQPAAKGRPPATRPAAKPGRAVEAPAGAAPVPVVSSRGREKR